MLPSTRPWTSGANITTNCAEFPGPNVIGKLSPLKLYPAPVTLTDEIVIFDVPVFDSLAESTFEPPTMTLPNQRFPGLQLKAPVFIKKIAVELLSLCPLSQCRRQAKA